MKVLFKNFLKSLPDLQFTWPFLLAGDANFCDSKDGIPVIITPFFFRDFTQFFMNLFSSFFFICSNTSRKTDHQTSH